ncbi:MAG: hypothetical protein R3Y05_00365 [bacterium]
MDKTINEDLIYNTSSRLPMCFCIDTTLEKSVLTQIELGLISMHNYIGKKDGLRESSEVAIVTFDNLSAVLHDYMSYEQFKGIELNNSKLGSDFGDVSSGITNSIDLLQKRKKLYNVHGVDYYKPWLVIITDGKPIPKICKKKTAAARKKLLALEKSNKLTIVTIYINDDSLNCNLTDINLKMKEKIVKFSKKVEPQVIRKNKIINFFTWFTKSIETTAFTDEIKLDFTGLTDWEDI